MQKKLLLISAFSFLFFCVTTQTVLAQQPARVENVIDEQVKILESNQTEGKTSAESFVYDGIWTNILLSGLIDLSGNSNGLADGAVQSVGKMIGMTYDTPPANTKTYVASLLKDMNVAEPAYAQGLGFSALTPVLSLWKTFRNIAYVFFVFVFLIIGFAIMFRQKIGGQAAVTVQQALPRIIVALLMVTFSYAIAGLLIDIMYVSMFFVITIFNTSGLVNPEFVAVTGDNTILSQNILQIGWGILTNGFAIDGGTTIGGLVSNALGGNLLAQGAGIFSNIIATLVLFIAVLIATFRTFFALLRVYLELILSIVFAPLILMMGAIQSNVFTNWIKGLVANLAVFPILLVFIMIGYMFMGFDNIQNPSSETGIGVSEQLNDSGFVPPFIPGRGNSSDLALLAGIAVIMLMQEVPGIVGKFKPKGVFDDLGQMAAKNLSQGWTGGELVPGVKFTHLGGVSSLPEYARVGSQTGTESGIERVLLGKREHRKAEAQYQREIFDKTGVDIERRRGGAWGAATNKGVTRRNAEKMEGPGTGKD